MERQLMDWFLPLVPYSSLLTERERIPTDHILPEFLPTIQTHNMNIFSVGYQYQQISHYFFE